MKRVWGALSALAVMLAAGLLAVGWRSSGRAMHPVPASIAWGLADYPDLHPEEVRVRGAQGLELVGRFFPGRRRAAVVVTHGYGADQDELLPVVQSLHAAGLGVMTYDMRGSGRTGGAVTFGTLERTDLRAVVGHLAKRPEVDPGRIGAFGFSLGGAVTLMAAADDQRIRAVVADSAWSDVDHWLKPRLGDVVLHPRETFTPVSLALVQLRGDARLGELHPREQVARISPRPVLFLHGGDDDAVPTHDSRINYAAAREPKELWVLPGMHHGDTVQPGGPASSERVASFFERALAG